VTGLIGYGVLVGGRAVGCRATRPGREVLGLHAVPVRRTAGLVTLALLAVFAVNAALEPIFHGAERQAEQGGLDPVPFPGGLGATFAAVLAVSVLCVAAPVAEELFFRGLVHGRCGASACRWPRSPRQPSSPPSTSCLRRSPSCSWSA
jgi:membrane protease YdiL (CAAX protease family)